MRQSYFGLIGIPLVSGAILVSFSSRVEFYLYNSIFTKSSLVRIVFIDVYPIDFIGNHQVLIIGCVAIATIIFWIFADRVESSDNWVYFSFFVFLAIAIGSAWTGIQLRLSDSGTFIHYPLLPGNSNLLYNDGLTMTQSGLIGAAIGGGITFLVLLAIQSWYKPPEALSDLFGRGVVDDCWSA